MQPIKKLKAQGLYGALFEKAALNIISGKFFLLIFIIFQLLFLAFFSLGWSIFKQTTLENRITHDQGMMKNISTLAENDFFELAETSYELKTITEGLLAQGVSEEEVLVYLEKQFFFLAKMRSFYDQVRLFGVDGFERIRVENSKGVQTLIPSDQLESKSERPYFEIISSLENDQFYLTQPKPMTEEGEIMRPLRVVVQSFFPVANPQTGKRFGYININFDADHLFGEIRSNLAMTDGEVHVVSNTGNWMYTKTAKAPFESLMGREISFRNDSPEIWAEITRNPEGRFLSRDAIVLHRKIMVTPILGVESTEDREGLVSSETQRFVDGFYVITVAESPHISTLFKEAPFAVFSVWGGYILFTLIMSFYIAYLVATRAAMKERTRHSLKMEAVGELTGGVAHDFNNLLTAVIGNLNLLEREKPSPKEKKMIKQALEAAWRGADLTKRLLAFSRKSNLMPRNLDLTSVLKDTKALIQTTIGDNITFKLDLPQEQHLVSIDPLEYQNAILNLAINARDAMKTGGSLTISVYSDRLSVETAKAMEVPPGRYVITKITDTGSGMSLAVQKQAIDPFFTTKPIGEGSGLGLSMAYGFAKQSGGDLKIISEEGKGTTILILLPEIEEDGPRDQ